jgi:O-antigen biosynthesis protein
LSTCNKSITPKASIIIPTRNNLEYTKLCLGSIHQLTNTRYEIIVVDNGSTDGTIEFLQQHPQIKVIYNNQNLGFPSACNQGINKAIGDYLVVLNNDTVVSYQWLERLIQIAESDDRIGLIGPKSNYVAGAQQDVTVNYRSATEMLDYAELLFLNYGTQWQEVALIVGFCMFIKRQVIEKIGLFDERFGIGNFEDNDFCLRTRIAQFKIAMALGIFIHHYGSKTFTQEKIDYEQLLQINQKKFMEKWNIPN